MREARHASRPSWVLSRGAPTTCAGPDHRACARPPRGQSPPRCRNVDVPHRPRRSTRAARRWSGPRRLPGGARHVRRAGSSGLRQARKPGSPSRSPPPRNRARRRCPRPRPALPGRSRRWCWRAARRGVHYPRERGRTGWPPSGGQLLGDALGRQGVLSHEGTPGTDLQTSNGTFVAALGGPHRTVRGSVHRPMT